MGMMQNHAMNVANADKVTLYIAKHGQFQCLSGSLDILMERYAHMSIAELRGELHERCGREINYSDLRTRMECLMVFAEYDGFATN